MSDFAIKLKLTGDSGDMQSAVDKARAKLDKLENSVEKQPKDWKAVSGAIKDYSGKITTAGKTTKDFLSKALKITGVAGAITTALGGIGFGALISGSIASAKQIRQHTLNLNLDAEALTKWQYAAGKVGIDAEKMADIFKDMNDRVGDFARTGAGPLVDVMEQTNLKIEDLIKLKPDQQLLKVWNAIDKIQGISFAEKTFFLESFAGDASRLIPLLENNGTKLKELSDRAEELNVVMSDLDVEMLHIATQHSDSFEQSLKGVSNEFTVELAPAIKTVANHIDDLAVSHGGWGQVANDVAIGVASGFGSVMKSIYSVQIGIAGIERGWIKANHALRIYTTFGTFKGDNLKKYREEEKAIDDLGLRIHSLRTAREKLTTFSGDSVFVKRLQKTRKEMEAQALATIAATKENNKQTGSTGLLAKALQDSIKATEGSTKSTKKATVADKEAAKKKKDLADAIKEANDQAQLVTDTWRNHTATLERDRASVGKNETQMYAYDLSLETVGKTKAKWSKKEVAQLVAYRKGTDAIKARQKAQEDADEKRKAELDTFNNYLEKLEIERLINAGLLDQARDLELAREISDKGMRDAIIAKESYNSKVKETNDLELEFANIINSEVTGALEGMVDTGSSLIDKLILKFIEASMAGKDLGNIFGGSGGSSGSSGGGFFGDIGTSISDWFNGIDQYATGGDHSGGWRIVGENGPELEATGSSRIFNAHDTKAILSGNNQQGSSPNGKLAITVDNLENQRAKVTSASQAEDGTLQVRMIIDQTKSEILNDARRGKHLAKVFEPKRMSR